MKTDYKFWYIRRDDDGFITECAVRFYEGEVTTQLEEVLPGRPPEFVTRYRRSRVLSRETLASVHGGGRWRKDSSGSDVVLFDSSDFGRIRSDEELVAFVNSQIKRDPIREVIDQQKERV